MRLLLHSLEEREAQQDRWRATVDILAELIEVQPALDATRVTIDPGTSVAHVCPSATAFVSVMRQELEKSAARLRNDRELIVGLEP